MKKILLPVILGIALIGGGWLAYAKISFALANEDTDNAQLEANISPVVVRVGGYVTALNVQDNQMVKAGDTLVKIDDRDLKLRVLQAEIALRNAEANLALVSANVRAASAGVSTSKASFETAEAGIATAQANVETARVRVWRAGQDFSRYQQLLAQKSAIQQQFDNAKAEKETAEATLAAMEKQLEVARKQAGTGKAQENATEIQVSAMQKQIALAEAQIDQRRAELETARLQLSYAYMVAPMSGVVSRKSVQMGQLVNPGQTLFSITDESAPWVVANFKETQLEAIHVGQFVDIEADAYPGHSFSGVVESIAAATGARFSLLPPDNSTGNFVKVTQRIPVRIALKGAQDPARVLRAGMSVHAIVHVK